MDDAERGGQDALARHAVDDSRGHDHVDQRTVGECEQGDGGEELRRERQGAELHDLEERAARARELAGRDGDRGDDGDEQVDGAGDQEAGEQRPRVVALRIARLLGHVDRILEPDQGEERQPGAAHDGRDHGLSVLELEHPPAVDACAPVGDRGQADDDDQQQAGQLDRGEGQVQAHALGDAAEVHERHERDEDEPHQHRGNVDEGREVVAAECARQRGRRGEARAHDRERDEKRHERRTPTLVDVERRARACGYLVTSSA